MGIPLAQAKKQLSNIFSLYTEEEHMGEAKVV